MLKEVGRTTTRSYQRLLRVQYDMMEALTGTILREGRLMTEVCGDPDTDRR